MDHITPKYQQAPAWRHVTITGEAPDEVSRNVWVGVAHTGKDTRHKLEVYARFKGNRKDFFPLLEYKLIDDIWKTVAWITVETIVWSVLHCLLYRI